MFIHQTLEKPREQPHGQCRPIQPAGRRNLPHRVGPETDRIEHVRRAGAGWGQVFNRFYRPSEKVKGNGLGLAIVRAICEYHGWAVGYRYEEDMHCFTVGF